MRSLTIACLLVGIALPTIQNVPASKQTDPAAQTQKKTKKERGVPPSDAQPQESNSEPTFAGGDYENVDAQSRRDVRDAQLAALQDKIARMEKQLQAMTENLEAVADKSKQNRSESHTGISIWEIIAVGTAISAMLTVVGGLFWMRNASESGIRKALHDAGLL